MKRRSPNLRGFTMLELALASVVATIVAFAALALFSAMSRSDDRLSARNERVNDIERTRLAFQRAFTSIVASDRVTRRNDPSINSNTATRTDLDASARVKLAGTGEGITDGTREPPPRVVLGPDDSAASAAGLGAGPQRLEMVLARSPLPVALPPIFGNEAPARPTSIEEERTNTMQSGGAAAIRGAFTLRPQTAPAGKDARPNVGQLWELWWIPLPPIQDNPDLPPLPMSAAAGVPVRLCSDLVRCSWRFFRENEWRTEYRVTGARELPAYAETDIELANGIRGKWLMEIDYSTGAEFTASGLDESDPLTRDPSGRTPDGRSPTSGTGTAGTTRARPSTGGGR